LARKTILLLYRGRGSDSHSKRIRKLGTVEGMLYYKGIRLGVGY